MRKNTRFFWSWIGMSAGVLIGTVGLTSLANSAPVTSKAQDHIVSAQQNVSSLPSPTVVNRRHQVNSFRDPAAFEQLDAYGQSVEEWISSENNMFLIPRVNSLFRNRGDLKYDDIRELQIEKFDPQTVKVSITLYPGLEFSSGSRYCSWNISLYNIHVGREDPVLKQSIDVQHKYSINQWVQHEEGSGPKDRLAWKIIDTFGQSSLGTFNVSSLEITKASNDSIGVKVTLLPAFVFASSGTQTMYGTVKLINLKTTFGQPKLFNSIDLKHLQNNDEWMTSENRKTVSEQIKDLLADPDLDSNVVENIKVFSLDDSVLVSITLKKDYSFDQPSGILGDNWQLWMGFTKLINSSGIPTTWVSVPTLKNSIDLQNKVSVRQWISQQEGTSATDKIASKITNLFGDKSSLTTTNVQSIEITQESNNKAKVTVTLGKGCIFEEQYSKSFTGELTLINPVIEISLPKLKTSINLSSEQTLDQWLRAENSKEPDAKINDLFADKSTLTSASLQSLTITKSAPNKIKVTVDLGKGFVFTGGTKSLTGEIVLVSSSTEVALPTPQTSIDLHNQQTPEQWLSNETTKKLSEQINDLFGDKSALNTTNVQSLVITRTTSDQINVTVNLKKGFVFTGGATSFASKISLINPTMVIALPTLQALVDLHNRQTLDQWMSAENTKELDAKINDLFGEDTSLSTYNVSDLEITKTSNTTVNVDVTLSPGYVFDNGEVSMNETFRFTNPLLLTKTHSVSIITTDVIGSVCLAILILGLGFGIPRHMQHKIEEIKTKLNNQRNNKLSAIKRSRVF